MKSEPETLKEIEEAIAAAVREGNLEEVAQLRERWRDIYLLERLSNG